MNFLKKNKKTFKEGLYIGLVVGIGVAIVALIRNGYLTF